MTDSGSREGGDARAGHLDHFTTGLGAVAAGGGALLHVLVVGELLALGPAQVARRAAVVTGLQRPEVFLLTLGEHRRAVVEAGFALLGAVHASLGALGHFRAVMDVPGRLVIGPNRGDERERGQSD